MKVLVTGAAGMIGSHLVDALIDRGDNIIGIDDLSHGSLRNLNTKIYYPSFKFLECDVRNRQVLDAISKDVDVIFHLAAVKKIGEKDVELPTLSVAGLGTMTVFDVARKNNCKVVVASTSDVYGSWGESSDNLNETDCSLIGPSYIKRWGYASAKLYAEHLAYAYYREFNVPMVILRYCGAYSHRSSVKSGGHVPIFINAILNGESVTIHGDGSQTRPFLHVNDLVTFTLLAAESREAEGEILNIGGKEDISILDMAKLIHRIADTRRPLVLKYVTIDSVFGKYQEIMRRRIDMSKAERVLGYEQSITLEEGLRLIINNWRSRESTTSSRSKT